MLMKKCQGSRMETIDSYMIDEGVANIDLLKIDVEGYELEVLEGAKDALASRRIKAILAECDFEPKDTQHTYFNDLWDYLRSKNFSFFGLYDVIHYGNGMGIGFCNALFIEKSLRERKLTQSRPWQKYPVLFLWPSRMHHSFAPRLPPLFKMAAKVECEIIVILDASKAKGVLGESLEQSELSEIIEILKEIKKQHSFEMEVFSPDPNEVLQLSKIHMGKSYRETHCFRGYPIHGSIRQFHTYNSDYVLHLDCDMLFYEEEGFSLD